MASTDGSDDEELDMFREPSDYYPPEKPHQIVQHTLQSGQAISLRLLGHSPLWGHLLWNGAKVVTSYLEENADRLVKGKSVLELGAGAGLPSLVCASLGARMVVASDYPDPNLLRNLQYNFQSLEGHSNIIARGYLWGNDTEPILAELPEPKLGFDLLILADVVFNHTEHGKLVRTIKSTLKRDLEARALVFFTPYRPWLLEKDLNFFTVVQEQGLVVNKILQLTMDRVMFENDPGDEVLRRTVFGYEVRWNV